MACEICKGSEETRSATRLQNKAMRTTIRLLRRRFDDLVRQRDEIVESMIYTPNPAEDAFGELWGSALFDCGPEDYDSMVESIKDAFRDLEGYKAQKPKATAKVY